MYKIYINHSLLILCSLEVFRELDQSRIALSFMYNGNRKRLHNVVDLLEKSTKKQRTVIYSTDLKSLWKDFKSIHQFRKAGGGIVFNEMGELLVIFRRGLWDLPKGHSKSGEKMKETALREVKEECGVKDLSIQRKVGHTLHVYRIKGKKVLKKSVWYHMTSKKQALTPQTKEEIDEAIWVNPEKFMNEYDMYSNIKDILKTHFRLIS
jgi:8-oxo-dGTP pyrophosphatase MutT (NUDIX family)